MTTGRKPPMIGLVCQDDVGVKTAYAVGDSQTMFNRAFGQTWYLRDEIVRMQARHDVEMPQMRVDMRQAQQGVRHAQAESSSGRCGTKLHLVDVKSMSPSG